jgi:solute carrier family 25 oxoglutarate transporter 11
MAGGLGSIVGTPADLILIRMQTDNMLPPAERRNYTSVFNAAKRIP